VSKHIKEFKFLFWLLIIPLDLAAQNLNQSGFLPVLSHTFVTSKLDVNILGVSKISTTNQTAGGVLFPASTLEVYFQLQASLKLKNNITISGSYGFQRNNPFSDNYVNEHRLGQQLIWVTNLTKSHLYQRFRYEERLIESSDHQSYQFGTRGRYQIGLNHNLGTSNYFINFSNEIFVIPTGPRNAFVPENIAYIGIGRKARVSNIEIGLFYNTIVRNSNHDLRNLLLLQIMWSSTMTRMKEKKDNVTHHMRHF
jgi:hypothetical protein